MPSKSSKNLSNNKKNGWYLERRLHPSGVEKFIAIKYHNGKETNHKWLYERDKFIHGSLERDQNYTNRIVVHNTEFSRENYEKVSNQIDVRGIDTRNEKIKKKNKDTKKRTKKSNSQVIRKSKINTNKNKSKKTKEKKTKETNKTKNKRNIEINGKVIYSPSENELSEFLDNLQSIRKPIIGSSKKSQIRSSVGFNSELETFGVIAKKYIKIDRNGFSVLITDIKTALEQNLYNIRYAIGHTHEKSLSDLFVLSLFPYASHKQLLSDDPHSNKTLKRYVFNIANKMIREKICGPLSHSVDILSIDRRKVLIEKFNPNTMQFYEEKSYIINSVFPFKTIEYILEISKNRTILSKPLKNPEKEITYFSLINSDLNVEILYVLINGYVFIIKGKKFDISKDLLKTSSLSKEYSSISKLYDYITHVKFLKKFERSLYYETYNFRTYPFWDLRSIEPFSLLTRSEVIYLNVDEEIRAKYVHNFFEGYFLFLKEFRKSLLNITKQSLNNLLQIPYMLLPNKSEIWEDPTKIINMEYVPSDLKRTMPKYLFFGNEYFSKEIEKIPQSKRLFFQLMSQNTIFIKIPESNNIDLENIIMNFFKSFAQNIFSQIAEIYSIESDFTFEESDGKNKRLMQTTLNAKCKHEKNGEKNIIKEIWLNYSQKKRFINDLFVKAKISMPSQRKDTDPNTYVSYITYGYSFDNEASLFIKEEIDSIFDYIKRSMNKTLQKDFLRYIDLIRFNTTFTFHRKDKSHAKSQASLSVLLIKYKEFIVFSHPSIGLNELIEISLLKKTSNSTYEYSEDGKSSLVLSRVNNVENLINRRKEISKMNIKEIRQKISDIFKIKFPDHTYKEDLIRYFILFELWKK